MSVDTPGWELTKDALLVAFKKSFLFRSDAVRYAMLFAMRNVPLPLFVAKAKANRQSVSVCQRSARIPHPASHVLRPAALQK